VDLVVDVEAPDLHVWDGGTSVVLGSDCAACVSVYIRALNTCPSVVGLRTSFCMIRQSSYFPELSCCKATDQQCRLATDALS
jgi:hypothetical protein